MMKFSYRIDDMEVRSCNESLLSEEPHTRAEIVKWGSNNSCYTLAHWNKDSDGFYLKFVGNRPLDEDFVVFMELVKIGQQFLDKYLQQKEL